MKGLYEKGKVIRSYRKMYALTQKELADSIGISHTLISKTESGKYQPSEQIMNKIQHFLKIREFTHQEDYQLSAQLSSWQQCIRQRNVTVSNQFYDKLREFPISYFYNQQSLYYLRCFQHYLLQLQIEKASPLLDNIKKELNRLSDRACYPFYKALGYYYVLTDALRKANHYLNLAVSTKPDDYERDGELHLYFALLYHKLKNIPYSMEHTSKAIHLFGQQMNHPNVMAGHVVTAMNDLLLNRHNRGLENIQNILIQIKNNQLINMQALYVLLGIAYMQQKNYNKALQYAKDAVVKEQDSFLKQTYLYLVAYIFAMMHNKKQALSYIEAGLALKTNRKYYYKLLMLREIILNNICATSFQKKLHEDIIPFFHKNEDKVELSHCYQLMGQAQYRMQNYKQSALYFQKASGNQWITELLLKYVPH